MNKEVCSQAKAREIMGKNFLGMQEVGLGYAFAYTKEQLLQLAEIPFSEETLQACKDTHVLVAGSALSLNEIRKIASSGFSDSNWFTCEPFANKKVSVRWYLLRKKLVPESHSKTYDQQTPLLTKEEEVSFACELIYMVILYWLTHRKRLLQYDHARCQDKDSKGSRVSVGRFDSTGLFVGSDMDGSRGWNLGLASSVLPWKS